MANGPTEAEIATSHRWFAVECNNAAWAIADQPTRTSAETDHMLHAAHAAAWHWGQVGTAVNTARAELLLGHAHALAGHGDLARRYAQSSFDYVSSHDSPDWERAMVHAVLANAAHAAGDTALHRSCLRDAQRLTREIADADDRAIVEVMLNRIPAPPP